MASVSAYRAGSFFARRLPSAVGGAGAKVAGALAGSSGEKRRLVAHNLERVLGRTMSPTERRRRVAGVFEWYAKYYLESFRLPDMSSTEIDQGFAYSGVAEIEKAVANGQGPILALPHLGTWEWAGFWVVNVLKHRLTAVAEPLDPPELFEWFQGLRESLGMTIVAVGPEAGRVSVRALGNGEVLCLPCDRDIVGNGVVVDFFGERTTLPGGPATLALRTGSPLLPTAVYWRDGVRFGEVRPPIPVERRGRLRDDVARITQDLAHEFEILIRKAPEQWHMMSPNWPSDYRLLGMDLPEHLRDLDS